MITIVVPVMNEEEVLPSFYKELTKELKKIKREYEIIFIDDGSKDTSLAILKDFAKRDKRIRVFAFRRNLGKAEALTYGFSKSRGEKIVTLDADLQNPPSEIQHILNELEKGYDVVCGWRNHRQDRQYTKITSAVFNRLVGIFFGLYIHDYNCGLKGFTKDVVRSLRLYGGLHRFIPLIADQLGFSVVELPVRHEKRTLGYSKYSFTKVFTQLPDIFTMLFLIKYSKRPLHFFGSMGSLLSFTGLVIVGYFTIYHMATLKPIGNRPLLFIGMISFIAGIQIFFTGFLADLILNINESHRSPDKSMKDFLKYTSDHDQEIDNSHG